MKMLVASLSLGMFRNEAELFSSPISDGYDFAQIAICFLLPFKGKCIYELYSYDKKGKPVSIKTACLGTSILIL